MKNQEKNKEEGDDPSRRRNNEEGEDLESKGKKGNADRHEKDNGGDEKGDGWLEEGDHSQDEGKEGIVAYAQQRFTEKCAKGFHSEVQFSGEAKISGKEESDTQCAKACPSLPLPLILAETGAVGSYIFSGGRKNIGI